MQGISNRTRWWGGRQQAPHRPCITCHARNTCVDARQRSRCYREHLRSVQRMSVFISRTWRTHFIQSDKVGKGRVSGACQPSAGAASLLQDYLPQCISRHVMQPHCFPSRNQSRPASRSVFLWCWVPHRCTKRRLRRSPAKLVLWKFFVQRTEQSRSKGRVCFHCAPSAMT